MLNVCKYQCESTRDQLKKRIMVKIMDVFDQYKYDKRIMYAS